MSAISFHLKGRFSSIFTREITSFTSIWFPAQVLSEKEFKEKNFSKEEQILSFYRRTQKVLSEKEFKGKKLFQRGANSFLL